MLDAEVVGRIIRRFRESKGLSQDVLSGLAGIGRTHLSAIERGERKPTLETFYRLSIALNVKSSELFSAVEDEISNC
jgi:transcriptional regulator with XRE-family HTH domain